jgi:hypothetical protein
LLLGVLGAEAGTGDRYGMSANVRLRWILSLRIPEHPDADSDRS